MKKLLFFATALLVLASCSNKDNTLNNAPEGTPFKKGQQVTLTVGTGNNANQAAPRKVAGTDNGTQINFTWEAGDQILVKVGDKSAVFTLSSEPGSADGEFTGTMPADGSTFDIQYPIEAPDLSAQVYTEENPIPADKMLFTATNCTLDNPATLKAQNAMLQLNLYGTDITVGKIVFWVKGAMGFSPLTLTCTGGKAIGAAKSAATPFYMVVPVGEYTFEVEVWDAATTPAKICSFATSEAKTFVAGECLNMPAKEVDAVAPVEWTKPLSLGEETATAIVIETGVDVSGYSEDANHKKLNEEGDLWEVLDADTLHIQTPANKINSSLEGMFSGYVSIISVMGLQSIHATTAESMFQNCGMLQSLDLSGFDTKKVADMSNMFNGCKGLTSLKLSDNFKVASSKSNMFEMCGVNSDCMVSGVSDDDIKTALITDTGWNWNYMSYF